MKNLKLIAIAAALFCTLAPAPASAQFYRGNVVRVAQNGSDNSAAIAQNGTDNTARIAQNGNGNTGRIVQNGSHNRACLYQRGNGLDGAYASDLEAMIQGLRNVPVWVHGHTHVRRLYRVGATDVVGGISQTVVRDGWRFDIGGHRFFTKVAEVRTILIWKPKSCV